MLYLIYMDKFSYYLNLVIMLIRGTLYQLYWLNFRGWILLGPGSKIYGLSRLRLKGIIKIGSYSTVDARFCNRVSLGNRFSLGDHSILRASGSYKFMCPGVDISEHVTFGPYSTIGGGFGLSIGKDCVFGPYVSIHPEGHVFSDGLTPIRQQGIHGSGIVIGENNWFGAKTTILDGAVIESGSVFGAQSLLTKGNYFSNIIYVGSPVKATRSRVS